MSTPAANALLSVPLRHGKAVDPVPLPQPGDCAIVRLTVALAAGDESAFRQFHDRYFDRLYRFLLVVAGGQEQEAKDALQQTFLRVVKHARVFEDEEALWSWLKVLARSAARDGGRKQRRYSILLQNFAARLNLDSSRQPQHVEEDRLQDALQESMAELEPEERALLEAKYVKGFSVREISAEKQETEKAIESRLGRMRQLLRDKVLKKLSRV